MRRGRHVARELRVEPGILCDISSTGFGPRRPLSIIQYYASRIIEVLQGIYARMKVWLTYT